MADSPELNKDRRTGFYYVAIPIAGTNRRKWVCTGERGLTAAQNVVEMFGVDRLLHLHNAQCLTAEAVALVTTGKVITCMEVYRLWYKWHIDRRSPGTHNVYCELIMALLRFHGVVDQPIGLLSEDMVREYVNRGETSYAARSLRLVAVRSFLRFASARALIVGNPSELVEVNRREMTVSQLESKPTQPWTDEEYAKILALPQDFVWRDWVILSYCTGLRLVDCVGFEWASLLPNAIIAFPLKTRNSCRQTRLELPLSDPLIGRPELLDLIARLRARERIDDTYVWYYDRMNYAEPTRCRALNWPFYMKKRKLGIPKTFHGLRTTFARRLQAAGKTIEEIAGHMGHSTTATTAGYLAPVTAALPTSRAETDSSVPVHSSGD